MSDHRSRSTGILRRLGRADDGFALPAVLGIALVLLIFAATALSVTLGGFRKAVTDEDWAGALAAAYAGIEEYQSRLSDDSRYYRYGNPAAAFSATSSTSLTLPTGTDANPAFEITAGGGWAAVPGSSNGASFRYEVDNSQYFTKGTLRIRSTGRVGVATRTVVADLRQSGFIDFLYFTQYETIDPLVGNGGNSACARHTWDSPARPSSCTEIQFGAADVLNGPVHSNDRLVICGSTFKGTVTTSNPDSPIYSKPSGCSNPTLPAGLSVTYAKPLDAPPTNGSMKSETRADLPTDVPRPGCMYTGPTQITLLSNGKMNVISPFTKVTHPSYTSGTPSKTPSQCGAISDLNSAAGATIDVLSQNLIYVQNVPATSGDPNYWASNKYPSGFTCSNKGAANEGWTFGSVSYPLSNEVMPNTASTSAPPYGCRNGDAYVVGTFKGAMTIASENFIYATEDIVYADNESILGLVGNNAVWVWNPIVQDCSRSWWGGTSCGSEYNGRSEDGGGREIDAAILSVGHTFMVQNYDKGNARGDLKILGAIAQNFRGTVARTSGGSIITGFAKDYNYDERLRYTAPPKFLTPVSTSYGITQFANVPAAFGADGSPS